MDSEAAISARLRYLRNKEGFTVERRRRVAGGALREYRVVVPQPAGEQTRLEWR